MEEMIVAHLLVGVPGVGKPPRSLLSVIGRSGFLALEGGGNANSTPAIHQL